MIRPDLTASALAPCLGLRQACRLGSFLWGHRVEIRHGGCCRHACQLAPVRSLQLTASREMECRQYFSGAGMPASSLFLCLRYAVGARC